MASITETNERTALRALELICSGDTGPAVDAVIHPEAVDHRPSGPAPGGRDGFRLLVERHRAAFAEVTITPLDVIAAGAKVVARTRFRGLHVGPFRGLAPTNRTIEFEQIHIWRLENGLLAEHWACIDEVGALRQMGVEIP